jgi:hypothetical protein
MRNYSKTVGALAAASTLVAGYASAEIEGDVHVGYHNMYEFRFMDQGNDLIEAGADVAATFGDFGVSAGAWYGSFDVAALGGLVGGNGKINFDELDLYVAGSYSVGDLTFELGYIYYYFPDTGSIFTAAGTPFVSNTQEVYFGLTYDFSFGLSANSTFYYDFDAGSGWYSDTSLSYSYEIIPDCLSVDVAAGVAFADGLGTQAAAKPGVTPGSTNDGYQGFYASLALPYQFRDNVTITPYVKYTNADGGLGTDPRLIGATTPGQDFLISGVTLSVGF